MTAVEALGTGAVGSRGVFTALVTPFDEGGLLDRAALELLVEAQVAAGVDGVVVCGCTGEFPCLTESERLYALEVVATVACGKIKVTVQVGHTSTAVATALARHAASYEVDALLVAPPVLRSARRGRPDHLPPRSLCRRAGIAADRVQLP